MSLFFSLADLGLPTSSGEYLAIWLDQMQSAFPGYQPAEGNLEYKQAQVISSMAADVGQLCAAGSQELFRTYGTSLIGLPYQQGATASAVVTITAGDTLGHTLNAGEQLQLTLGGAPVGFQTLNPLVIPNGSSSGTVTAVAVQPGSAFNGATGPAQMIAQIDWITGVTVSAPAGGGQDQETDDHYLQRLAQMLQLMALRPITAQDFATLALNFTPIIGTDQEQVGRATALDGYNPADGSSGNQKMVAVVVTDTSGIALNNDTMYGVGGSSGSIVTNPASWGIAGWLQSLREVNFVVNVLAPSYSTVYVSCQVKAIPGWLPSVVQANVQTAILGLLNPAAWGLPPSATVGWNNNSVVVRSVLESVIQQSAGVQSVVTGSVALGLAANPSNTTGDLTLPGPVPLPVTTTISVPLSGIQVS